MICQKKSNKLFTERYFFCVIFFSIFYLSAQKKDTIAPQIKKKSEWSPAKKATIYSACLPGLGQIHNKKYWKVPVIYSALGGMGYFIIRNHNQYKNFQNAIIYRYDQVIGNETYSQYSVDNLVTLKRSSRRLRDFSILGAGLIYLLQIIDANVDAHLMNFDVDNISIKLNPEIKPDLSSNRTKNLGLSINFSFKK